MSADYNGTDKSNCSGRHWARWSSSGKGRWPGCAIPGLWVGHRAAPTALGPGSPSPPGAGFSVYFLLNLWSSCRRSKQVEEFSWRLVQITENRKKQELIFSTDGLFSISKIIFFVWRNPWENTAELGDFLPAFSLKERKFWGISEQRKWKEENWGQGMWPNHIEMQTSPGWEITQIPAKTLWKYNTDFFSSLSKWLDILFSSLPPSPTLLVYCKKRSGLHKCGLSLVKTRQCCVTD